MKIWMSSALIGVTLAGAIATFAYAGITLEGHANKQLHDVSRATTSPSDIVGVMLQDSESDGDPLEVARGAISEVHDCHGSGYARTCLARLDGINSLVFVAGVDFPDAH